MSDAPEQAAIEAWDEAAFLDMQARANGRNLDPVTLLATDYLNHFNEIVMLLEMIPDMPEIIEDTREWKPKSYKEHFRTSTIADRELAIEAYDVVPTRFKAPFEQTVLILDQLILSSIDRLSTDIQEGNIEIVRENARTLSRTIQQLMDTASGIIHGSTKSLDQSAVDSLIAGD